jgi:peptide/nickel transport system substrate-binding protein
MMRYLRNNIGEPGKYGVIPPGMQAFDTSMACYAYDPDEARRLISACFDNGYTFEQPLTIHTNPDYVDLCKYLQQQWGELGVPVDIEVQPAATLRELKARAELGIFRASWIADYPDEENYLSLFFSGNFTPHGPNYTHFQDDRYDSLYLASQLITDDSSRRQVYREMNRIIIEEAPVVVLYYDKVLRFISHQVTGLGTNAMNMLDLRTVRKTNHPEMAR